MVFLNAKKVEQMGKAYVSEMRMNVTLNKNNNQDMFQIFQRFMLLWQIHFKSLYIPLSMYVTINTLIGRRLP